MTGFSDKMKKRIKKIEKMEKQGKTKGEIKDYFLTKKQWKKDKFHRTWASYKQGVVVAHSRPISYYPKKQKKYLHRGKCYFCSSIKVIEHHISYNPERIITICVSCHGKTHFLDKKYHELNKQKDERLTLVNNYLHTQIQEMKKLQQLLKK